MTRVCVRLALAALMLAPMVANAWWNDEWTFRKQLTIDTAATGANLPTALNDVPVLVRLHSGNFQYFLDMKESGSDIRFIGADEQTPLKFHVERIDPVNEMAFLWVKVPQIAASSNAGKLWMYYGNETAPPAQDVGASFDVHQTLVYHLSDKTGAPHDSSAYGNHAEAFTGALASASLIGGGARFDGHQVLRVGPKPSLRFSPETGATFSMWFKFEVPQPNAQLMQWLDGTSGVALVAHNGNIAARATINGKAVESSAVSTSPGAWHHVAVALTAERMTLFVDGNESAAAAVRVPAFGGVLNVGGTADGSYGFIGEIDEVQASNVARDAAWIRAAFTSQGPESKLLVAGGDESGEGSGTSYFGVILQNVTVDGWVVIVILAIMAAISWVVMFGKGIYINRVRRDNAQFLDAFKANSGDPGALDAKDSEDDKEIESSPVAQALFGKHDHFQSSSLYRIYHAGVQDLNRRLGRAVGAQASGLSPQAVATLRAGMDAAMVRELQRLNRQMVLLTIAISGGPFLGLLGTVVGVMITFAAIAASGDVNVNAIAPGIAAALVATVAGLAVAIPALFGYNYLSSRIKEISADMQVFVDEFITRVAEHYS